MDLKELLERMNQEAEALEGEPRLDQLSPDLQADLEKDVPPEIHQHGLERVKWYLESFS